MRSPYVTAARALALLTGFIVTAVIAGVVAAGLFLPATQAAGVLTRNSVAFFDSLPTELNEMPLSEQSVMLARNGQVIARFFDENRTVISLARMSPYIQQAIVAIEDERFYQHGGVDSRGVLRAFTKDMLTNDVQGASTLTQQYVKNVLVESAVIQGNKTSAAAATERSKARKIREMKLAIALEKKYTKDQILQGYLNIALFGDSTYGVEAASYYYFKKHASQLNLSEAATLAGLVQSPNNYNPRLHPKAAQDRRDVVLSRMLQLGIITTAEYSQAHQTKLTTKGVLKISRPHSGCANAGLYAYFCQYVYQTIIQNPAFSALGKTEHERTLAIARNGLTIRTTIDPSLEQAAWDAVTSKLPPTDKSQISTATATVQAGTGQIMQMTQNSVYSLTPGRGRTSVNYATDKDYGGSSGFQIGSTAKPFTLAAWLAAGHSAMDIVDANVTTHPYHDFTSCGKKLPDAGQKPWTPGNSEGDEGGNMTAAAAMALSVNAAYVNMESKLDLCDIADIQNRLGMHIAAPSKECTATGFSTRIPACVPAMTLGVFPTAPLTLAAAYAGFANQGTYCSPIAVTAIGGRDANGRIQKSLKVPGSQCSQAIEPDVAAGVDWVLQKVVQDPSGTAYGRATLDGHVAGGKTGTTNEDMDTWFTGFTPQMSTAVWVGDGRSVHRHNLRNVTVKGKHYRQIYGRDMAAPIWKLIMTKALQGLPNESFPEPNPDMIKQAQIGVPDVSGMTPQDATTQLEGAGFTAQVMPQQVNSPQPAGTVAFTAPGAGSQVNAGTTITLFLSNGQGGGLPGQGGGLPGQGGTSPTTSPTTSPGHGRRTIAPTG